MLRHKGFRRNFKHNLFLAILFSFVAGIINVSGLLLFNVFTTNLTGHVGEFALSIYSNQWMDWVRVFLWLISFMAGSFFAALLTNFLDKLYPKISYALPVIIEIVVLLAVITGPDYFPESFNDSNQLLLLFFSMGLQNGIVSVVSGNIVRTTHLTGMVTDFGIGLSELILQDKRGKKTREKVTLAGTIIFSFLLGGVVSAYFTHTFHIHFLYFPVAILLFILSFDFLRISYLLLKRKSRGFK